MAAAFQQQQQQQQQQNPQLNAEAAEDLGFAEGCGMLPFVMRGDMKDGKMPEELGKFVRTLKSAFGKMARRDAQEVAPEGPVAPPNDANANQQDAGAREEDDAPNDLAGFDASVANAIYSLTDLIVTHHEDQAATINTILLLWMLMDFNSDLVLKNETFEFFGAGKFPDSVKGGSGSGKTDRLGRQSLTTFHNLLSKYLIVNKEAGKHTILIPKANTAATIISTYTAKAVAPFNFSDATTNKDAMWTALTLDNQLNELPMVLRTRVLGLSYGMMSRLYTTFPTNTNANPAQFATYFRETFGQCEPGTTIMKNHRLPGVDSTPENGGPHFRRMSNVLLSIGLALYILPNAREFEAVSSITNADTNYTLLLFKLVSQLSFLLATLASKNLFERITLLEVVEELNKKIFFIKDNESEAFSVQKMMRDLAHETNEGLKNLGDLTQELMFDMSIFKDSKDDVISAQSTRIVTLEDKLLKLEAAKTTIEGRFSEEKKLREEATKNCAGYAARLDTLEGSLRKQQSEAGRRDREEYPKKSFNENRGCQDGGYGGGRAGGRAGRGGRGGRGGDRD